MKFKPLTLPVIFYTIMVYFYLSFGIYDDNLVYLIRFSNNPVFSLLAFTGLLLICRKFYPLIRQPRCKLFYFLSFIIAGFFSIVSINTRFFKVEYSIEEYIHTSSLALPKLALIFVGGLFTFFAVIQIIGSIRKISFDYPISDRIKKFMAFMFNSKTFPKTLRFIAVVWLPQILVRYPGALTPDAQRCLLQYWGVNPFTTQHPILYTLALGKVMDLGIALGHPALSLYIFVLIQTVLLLLVLAYAVYTMNRFHFPKWLLVLSLLFFAFGPIFIAPATTVVVDGIYNSFALLLMIELVYYLFSHKKFVRCWYHYLLTAVAVFGLIFRHNGFYTGLLVAVLAVFMEIFFHIKKENKIRYSILFLAVLLLPLFGSRTLSNNLYQQYDAQKYSTRAMLALPIQQVSRCFAEYGDEIDPEIQTAVKKVLEWNANFYKYIYNPRSFDSIKQGFNLKASSEDIKGFLQAWGKLFQKYPTTCILATLNQTYDLFSSQVVNQFYYRPFDVLMDTEGCIIPELTKAEATPNAPNRLLGQYYYIFGFIPGVGLLVNQGFTDLMLLIISLYALVEKRGKLLFLCMPLLLTLAIAFVGPMVLRQARYTYPIMYALPLLFGLFLTQSTQKSER